jgi:hypothetical protein
MLNMKRGVHIKKNKYLYVRTLLAMYVYNVCTVCLFIYKNVPRRQAKQNFKVQVQYQVQYSTVAMTPALKLQYKYIPSRRECAPHRIIN